MSIKTSKTLFVILIMTVLFYSPRPLFGTGPFFAETIFTCSLHPDFPLEKFARGELGILQPTYARSYLCVAYRYLIGVNFDQEEQKAILALWDERLNRRWEEDWIKNWLDTRNKVPGVGLPPRIDTYRRYEQGYSYYFNYPEDAFRTAVRTLNERIEQFGADSPEVKDWVQAQDSVFGPTIPAPANPGMHPLIQADRAYQIATAHFYQGTLSDLDVAEKMFRDIANDSSSPWRQIAPYLVARTLVRKATLGAGPGEADMDTLAQAEVQLKKVLSDRGLNTIHPAAKRMLNFVRFRLYSPEERLHELAQAILQKNSGETLKQDLWDYTWLLDKFAGDTGEYEQEKRFEEQEKRFEELSGVRRKDDVTDWLFTFQSKGKDALEHSMQMWSETLSLPWLVASLSKANIGHPKLPELLLAAGRVKQDSPAFPSVAFHTIRLMIESGRKEEARERLDSLLSKDSLTFPPSSLNLFLAQRMKLARNLDEFLKYAPRVPAGIGYYDSATELPFPENDEAGRTLLDADSVNVLNEKMPLSLLMEAAKNRILPDHLRWGLALTTWVRSILLDNEAISKELVPILENLVPELEEYLSAYLVAENPEARKFAAVFLMLKFPGTRPYIYSGMGRLTPLNRIDNLRDNWWRLFRPDEEHNVLGNYYEMRSSISEALRILYPEAKLDSPDFLNETQKATATVEWAKLSSIGTAPNYLCQQVLKWARRNHDDARIPEALHLAVKSTRYGKTDKETSKFSKAAFQFLHKRYPKSIWAEKTPYWY